MNLLNEVEKNKELRRLFGKKELEIIKKQLRGDILSDYEQSRLSRDIRKKFEVIEVLMEFSKEFDLKGKRSAGRPKGSKNKKKKVKKDSFKEGVEIILKDSYSKYIKRIYKYEQSLVVYFSGLSSRKKREFVDRIKGKVSVEIKVYGLLRSLERREVKKNGEVVWKK